MKYKNKIRFSIRKALKYVNISNNEWIFPFLGGCFALFSLFLPSAYTIINNRFTYFWLCGLVFSDGFIVNSNIQYKEGLNLINNPMIQVSSIFCSLILFLSGIFLIIIAIKFKINQDIQKRNKKIWFRFSILQVVAIISWSILVEIAYLMVNEMSFGFWYNNTPSFGLILPFCGALLSLVGYYKRRYYETQNLFKYKGTPKSNYYSFIISLTFIFTLLLTFFILIFPLIIDDNLRKITPYYTLAVPTEYVDFLRIIGWIFIAIIIIMIIMGYLIEKKEISFGGAFLVFLPNFSQFNSSMFFLYGIGIIQTIWLPLINPHFNWLGLGDIIYLPMGYIYSIFHTLDVFIGYYSLQLLNILTYLLLYFGFFISSLGAATWLYARIKKRKITDFSIYKFSRHPQYLGFIIWSYAFSIIPRGTALGGQILKSSLFWVISVLIIIGVALNEEIKMKKRFGEEYIKYQQKTPFLLPLPQIISSFLNYPIRKLIKKQFPENKKDILIILTFIVGIIILLSLPFILLGLPSIGYFT